MQPGWPGADIGQAGVDQFVSEHLPGAGRGLLPVEDWNMYLAVVAAAAPLRRSVSPVRFPALHDGHDPLFSPAAELVRNACELLLQNPYHRTGGVGVGDRAVVSQKKARAVFLLSAFIVFRLVQRSFVAAFDRGFGL